MFRLKANSGFHAASDSMQRRNAVTSRRQTSGHVGVAGDGRCTGSEVVPLAGSGASAG